MKTYHFVLTFKLKMVIKQCFRDKHFKNSLFELGVYSDYVTDQMLIRSRASRVLGERVAELRLLRMWYCTVIRCCNTEDRTQQFIVSPGCITRGDTIVACLL